MAKKNDRPSDDSTGRPTFTQREMGRARECFKKAQELVEKKNYDYAIEWYLNGLECWPEAVDEGHQACRAAALFRGGAKVSFTDSKVKYKTNVKDAKKAMLNAEMLLSKDPKNLGYMEAMFKNAARGRFDLTAMWIGEILAEAVGRDLKGNQNRLTMLREVFEELADRNQDDDVTFAIACMEQAVEALTRLRAVKPNDGELATELRDVTGKLTILKGRYSSAESFTDSMQDTESQRELHDKDRAVQSDDRMEVLVARARERYEAAPTDHAAVAELVDLLCRREEDQEETQAIGILVKAYKETDEYRFKLRADDIRIKQLNRKARAIVAAGDKQAAREMLGQKLKFELSVFKDRVQKYPTDMRVRYEYGRRLFEARRYDDAIPVLQEARNEPRTRFQCNLYIGRCFFEKGFHGQAVEVFREAIDTYEMPDDDLGKELHYWMARALEGNGKIPEALKVFGQILQWDYNYRKGDVRVRYEKLQQQDKETDAGDS